MREKEKKNSAQEKEINKNHDINNNDYEADDDHDDSISDNEDNETLAVNYVDIAWKRILYENSQPSLLDRKIQRIKAKSSRSCSLTATSCIPDTKQRVQSRSLPRCHNLKIGVVGGGTTGKL